MTWAGTALGTRGHVGPGQQGGSRTAHLVAGGLALLAVLLGFCVGTWVLLDGRVATHTTAAPTSASACVRAAPDSAAGYTQAFAAVWGRWAGGDQTSSVLLPDGRILWLFADTLQGDPGPGGQTTDARFVHNSFVLQTSGCFEPLAGPDGAEVIANPAPTSWYWPQQGVVVSDRLWVTAIRVAGGADNGLGFSLLGVDLAEFALEAGAPPRFLGLHPTPASAAGDFGVLWGTGLVRSGSWVYLYGTRRVAEDLVGKELLLARAPVDQVADPDAWRYRTSTGWGDQPSEAEVLHGARGGVSTAVSAHRSGTSWVVVTKRDDFLGDAVIALVGPTAWGPFEETELFESRSDESALEYLALAHPEIELADGALLVSVNHNRTSLADVLADPAAFRPTFWSVAGLR